MLLFVIGLLIASPAPALERSDCPAVDYSAELGPVRDQGKSDWCWAMTAADIMGHGHGLTPKQQVSVAELVSACADFDPEKTPKSLSLLQGRTFARLLAQHKGKPAGKASAFALAGAYCLAARGYACLESEVPSSNYFGTKLAFGSEELAAEMKAACKTKVYLQETRASFERFNRGEKSRSPAVIAGWLKLGSPVAIALKKSFFRKGRAGAEEQSEFSDHEALVVASRWKEKKGECEFRLRNSWGDPPIWLSEAEVARLTSHATRISTRPLDIPAPDSKVKDGG